MITNPTILAIDSSSGVCSVSILKNNNILSYVEEKTVSLQAKYLVLMIEEALSRSGIKYSDLSAIACTVGPGSFTGIRIGLATARAIGFATNIPVCGFSALEILAFNSLENNEKTPVIAVLNAGKGEVIYQSFDQGLKASCAPTIVEKKLAPAVPDALPRADWLALLAVKYQNKSVEPLPFYVRPPDAKLPNNKHVTTS